MIKNRREDVIQKAYELFLSNGYHATSIQDIIQYSEISKGSFYNHFSSKGDLLKAVFSSVITKLEEERDTLLVGEDPADIDIFSKQLIIAMELNKESKLSNLLEDAFVSNEPELTDLLKKYNQKFLRWVYKRFQDVFPDDKKPYLPDAAILFTGITYTLYRANKAINRNAEYTQIINYAVQCIRTILQDVSLTGIRIFSPEDMNQQSLDLEEEDVFNSQFLLATINLRKTIEKNLAIHQDKVAICLKFIYFIQEELLSGKTTRSFLIESALLSLSMYPEIQNTDEFSNYKSTLMKML